MVAIKNNYSKTLRFGRNFFYATLNQNYQKKFDYVIKKKGMGV